MNINFLNYGISPIQNTPLNKAQTPAKIFELKEDTFEKSVNFTGINSTGGDWNRAKIKEIYDRTYNEVIKQNPITKELNMEKPEILFTLDEWNNEAGAAYTVLLNAVEVSDALRGDYYLVTGVDKKGKATNPINAVPEKMAASMQMLYGRNPNVKFIKLNESEKEKFVSAILAHEFRHAIQEHLLLSTQGCEDHLETAKSTAKEAQDSLLESIEGEIAEGRKPNRTDRDYARCLSYMANYEPKKILSPDTKLDFSLNPKDKRCISVVKHLLPTADPDKRVNKIGVAYCAQPHEIDAYNYESEFFNNLITSKSVMDNSRDDVLRAISKLLSSNVEVGIKNMQKYGYAPIGRK